MAVREGFVAVWQLSERLLWPQACRTPARSCVTRLGRQSQNYIPKAPEGRLASTETLGRERTQGEQRTNLRFLVVRLVLAVVAYATLCHSLQAGRRAQKLQKALEWTYLRAEGRKLSLECHVLSKTQSSANILRKFERRRLSRIAEV